MDQDSTNTASTRMLSEDELLLVSGGARLSPQPDPSGIVSHNPPADLTGIVSHNPPAY